jgi:hypothetical protein
MAPTRSPFDVKLSETESTDLAAWLSDEIQYALDARNRVIAPGGDVDRFWWRYEQGTRGAGSLPWPDAADLGSFIPPEKVDALRARMMKTIFVEPVWVVEGWGKDAPRAPFVEEFHQWKLEEERLQQWMGKTLHNALVEGTGILECSERAEKRVSLKRASVEAVTGEDGSVLLDENGQPTPRMGDDGRYVVASSEEVPVVDAMIRDTSLVRKGPQYRLLSLRDFLFLPGHAKDQSELFGYAKRFFRRLPELQAREKEGVYSNVDALGTQSEREATQDELRAGTTIAPQRDDTVEKELWEVLFLKDLDGDGIEEWYVATVSIIHRTLLRVQHDDLGMPRYFAFTPFPRTNSVYGYSFTQKLESLADEHAAIRNMAADRSTLATSAPIKRVQGALWNPDEQPWGPRAVIDVRDPEELQAFVIPDVPVSVVNREQGILDAAERLSGLNDVALGQNPRTSRTLGEVQLVTEQSFVRMEESLRYCQETLEELFKVRHELWCRALEEEPEEAPARVERILAVRGLQLEDQRFTAQLLRGNFRGKPRGNVETADVNALRGDYNGFIQAIGMLMQMFPPIAQMIMANPEAIRALLEHGLRVYRVPDRQAFLGTPDQQAQMMMQPQMPGAMPGAPGAPPAPPMAGAGPAGMPAPGASTSVAPNPIEQLIAELGGPGGQGMPPTMS